MPEDLDTLLDSYQVGVLNSIAAHAGIDVSEKGRNPAKARTIARLREELFSEARVRQAWRSLSDRERQILNRLLLHGGEVSTRAFKQELLRAGLITTTPSRPGGDNVYVSYARGYAGHPKRTRSTVFEDIMARLTQRGLVFSRAPTQAWATSYKLEFHPGVTLLVPEAVRRFLPQPEPLPPTLANWKPRRMEVGAPELLLRDLYLYWDRARKAEATVIQSGLVNKRWLKVTNDLLLVPDPTLEAARREDETARLFLLRQLLQGLALLSDLERGAFRPAHDSLAIPPFWGRTSLEQRAECLRLWPETEERVQPEERGSTPPDVRDGKRALLRVLTSLPVGVWFTPEELLDRAAGAAGGSLLYGTGSAGDGYYGYGYGYNEDALVEREAKTEARLVTGWLQGFILEIGLIELGYDDGHLRGFRVTREGQTLMAASPPADAAAGAPAAAAGASVVVQPNFQVLALGPVSLATLARLDLCAERQRAGPAAFEYHLSRASVYAAQQIGMGAKEVERLLREATGAELPQNVSRSLAEWAAHHERIVFRDGVNLVHVADAGLLERLSQDARINGLGLRALTPEVALLPPGGQEPFVAALLEQGLLPAVSDLRPESADNSVLVAADGTIRAVHAVPSLYLRDRLARFAEALGDGRWRLTPRTVGRAGGSKGKVLRLLEELGKLHRGDLPARLEETIRVWGGYYGAAAMEDVTLVEFVDQETLTELLERPELGDALIPLAPGKGKRALAVVVDGRRAQVEEALRRLGVRIGGRIAR